MAEYSRILGDTVKRARLSLKLTQKRVAEKIDVDERTIMNIEKGISNPTLEVLYPLFQVLKIDSREILTPECRGSLKRNISYVCLQKTVLRKKRLF